MLVQSKLFKKRTCLKCGYFIIIYFYILVRFLMCFTTYYCLNVFISLCVVSILLLYWHFSVYLTTNIRF